jgi:hypothetical protein
LFALSAILLVACCTAAPKADPATRRMDPMETKTTTPNAGGASPWRARAAEQDGSDAVEIVVGPRGAGDTGQPASASRFAAGTAWLALGRRALARGDATVAVARAERGLEAIGRDYTTPMVDDDTRMKLLAGRDRLAEGHVADAASVLLRVLESRTSLLGERERLEVLETH